MLRYYLVAMLLVVGSLVVAAHFSRPAKPIETASVQSSGTPSAPRAQATFTVPPRGVHGEAPWALSALPECFEQEAEAHGPLAFVRAHLPAGMHAVIAPSVLDAADCLRLICLLSVGEFFDAFAGSVSDLREHLSIP